MRAWNSQVLKRNGFTLIELMTVVAVIAILASIALVAYSKIVASQRISQTKLRLKSLHGMLTEFEAATKFQKGPVGWMMWRGGSASYAYPPAFQPYNTNPLRLDFWRVRFRDDGAADGPPTTEVPPFDFNGGKPGGGAYAPGDACRNASMAVLNTNLALSYLYSVPTNRAALKAMPPDALMNLKHSPYGKVPLPNTNVGCFGILSGDTSPSIQYPNGCVMESNGRYFRCVAALPFPDGGGNGTTMSPPGNGPDWREEAAAVPLVLDAWGNPIIFVPGAGLRVQLKGERSNYDNADPAQHLFIVVTRDGKTRKLTAVMNGLPSGSPVVDIVGRPFFASAGPDGDFSKGDDNIYSFEE